MVDSRLWENIDKRLKELGLSARAASLKAGLHVDAIRTIKRGEIPSAERLAKIAKALDTSTAVLLGTEDYIPAADLPVKVAVVPRFVGVRLMDVNAGLGNGGAPDDYAEMDRFWLPADLIEQQLKGTPDDFVVMETEGQSMQPTLLNGDHVLVDRRKTNPSNPGLFAIWDGFGVVIKWIERVAHSDPPRLRLISENERFSTYEVLADEARVIGKIVWFARRL